MELEVKIRKKLRGFDLAVGFSVRDEVLALLGASGCGKSMTLKCIAGIEKPDEGRILLNGRTLFDSEKGVNLAPQERRVGYLFQDYALFPNMTVAENITFSLLERELARFSLAGLENSYPKELSGGQKQRTAFARILASNAELLLLDEPFSALDSYLKWQLELELLHLFDSYGRAAVLVSHDRAFINNTTHRTLEIELGHIYDYKVKYDEYVALRRERREQQLRAYENQQKMLADTEAFIERFRYKATKAVQVQSRIKQLAKVERIEVDEEDHAMLHLKFPPAPRSGSYPITVESLSKRYGDHLVFADATFTIHRGDKVAFVGKNGEGKSTLVKCIMGEITDYGGTLQLGHNVRTGYFAQNQAQLLNEQKTVFETVDDVAQGDIRTRIRDILGAFMFGGEASDKKVGVLSGGERSRLAMIRLLLEPVNLLILDEPTNHLDMRSKDVLKEALREFDGTLIVVSHDREFLDGLVDKVYEFGNKRVREHLGGIYEFLERRKIETLQELERKAQTVAAPAVTTKQPESVNAGMPDAKPQAVRSYEEQKERARRLRKLEKAVADAEQEIMTLEDKIATLEARMATPEGAAEPTLYTEHGQLKTALSEAMDRWTEASEALSEASAS